MLHPARRPLPPLVPLLVSLLATAALAGCRADDAPVGDDGTTVALLLADETRSRLVTRDAPALEQRLGSVCPGCRLVVEEAGGDPARQAAQLDEAVAAGADVVVLQATSAADGAALVERAGEVPVVAYERPLPGVDHVVAGDGAALGAAQAEATLAALGSGARGARVLVLDGAGGDAGEAARQQAVSRALGEARARVVVAPAGADGGAAEARRVTAAAVGRAPVDAIVAATDVQAAGALAAVRAAPGGSGVAVVGADADLAAVRRLVTGVQEASAWTDERALAERAADVAAALAVDAEVPEVAGTTRVEDVPTDLVAARPVSIGEVARLLVRRDVVTVAEVCDARTRPACERAGLL